MKRSIFCILVGAAAFIALLGDGSIMAAQPSPTAESAVAAMCSHNVETAKCPFCDPTRIERLGVCKEHGVPEALCVKCKPYLKAAFIAAGDWCQEHNTPESQCAICNPAKTNAANERAQSAGMELRWQRDPSTNCSTSSTPVTLASPSVAQTIGLQYGEVKPAPLSHTVERNAELAYNANRYARLSARAAGVTAEVIKDLGESVKKGDVLAIIDSTEVGSAKSDLLQAIELTKLWEANADRERALVDKGIGIEREALEAETRAAESRIAINRARQRLQNFGLSKQQIASVESEGDTSSLLELLAPFDGMIVERSAVMGEVVEPGKPLLAVADTGTMWGMVDLNESDLAVISTGQQAVVRLDGLPGRTFAGRLTWISTQVDPKTRTLRARIELDNGQGLLRANMFGRASIEAGGSREAMLVPKEAVQWEGCCNVAFVRTSTDGATYQPARLQLGYDAGDCYEVTGGLKPGDIVVTKGSYILKNEILKNAVGAGCCEVGHLKE